MWGETWSQQYLRQNQSPITVQLPDFGKAFRFSVLQLSHLENEDEIILNLDYVLESPRFGGFVLFDCFWKYLFYAWPIELEFLGWGLSIIFLIPAPPLLFWAGDPDAQERLKITGSIICEGWHWYTPIWQIIKQTHLSGALEGVRWAPSQNTDKESLLSEFVLCCQWSGCHLESIAEWKKEVLAARWLENRTTSSWAEGWWGW